MLKLSQVGWVGRQMTIYIYVSKDIRLDLNLCHYLAVVCYSLFSLLNLKLLANKTHFIVCHILNTTPQLVFVYILIRPSPVDET